MNRNKINKIRAISTLSSKLLKSVDLFSHFGSIMLSTESDVATWLTKTCNVIDYLSIIMKSDLSNKMKEVFFQTVAVSILQYGYTTWTLTKYTEKKLNGKYTRIPRSVMNKSWKQYPIKIVTVWPLTFHLKNHYSKTNKTDGWVTIFCYGLHWLTSIQCGHWVHSRRLARSDGL